ncbi:hemerythrin domain-containing protein [Kribbella sp. ALI-6-A]|uniref:hemerythrin domain-containing protein n=1 Tax=Kribbella sp. ALI-6-A TaxID=1933817 RepID=UPI00192CF24D|nr:hemerythrin domain-containing protein [Kribbella sp. ALI-6-A]
MTDRTEGLRLYDELIAVHTIMRRSTALVVDALQALIDGRPVRVATLIKLIDWQAAFVHHHHESEDELFWPVLRDRFPEVVAQLDALSVEHDKLDGALGQLSTEAAALRGVPAEQASARAVSLLPAALEVRDVLAGHLDTEEPVLVRLFPEVPAGEIITLRKAIVAGAPKAGPEWVLGLMENPSRAQGYDIMMANFPPPVRWLRPLLLRRYAKVRGSLAVD